MTYTQEQEIFRDWFEDNRVDLEIEFMNLEPENAPLDDDIPDFFDEHFEAFEAFARQRFKDWRRER